MGQIGVLGIHAHTALESAGLVGLYHGLESIEVAFVLFHLERMHLVDLAPVGIGLIVEHHKLQTHSVVEALLIDDIGHGVFLARFAPFV